MTTLQNYILWLSSQNGGYGLGSTPKLAQAFLHGVDNARHYKIGQDAIDLHKDYMSE